MDSAIQKELTCRICLNYLIDPITIHCGHSYCRPCLCLFWDTVPTAICPMCRKTAVQKELKTNTLVKNLVSRARQANLRQFLSSEEQMCGTHREIKTIFCNMSQNLLCVLCSKTQEHRGHRHCSIECAVKDYRETLLRQMRSIWEMIQENQKNLNEESQIIEGWENYVSKVQHAYESFHLVLFVEVQNHVDELENEGKNIFQKLRESEAAMVQKKKHLREMYEELMNICHKPDVELLQDLGDILTRSDSVQLHLPQPMNPMLSARPIPGLIHRLNQFRVEIVFQKEMSNKKSMLFDDMKRLGLRYGLQDVPFPSRKCNYFYVWGENDLTTGKHYWEMEVNNSFDWAVGVCNKDSWISSNYSLDESEDIFFLLCLKEGDCRYLWTTSPMTCHYLEKPAGYIGVFVDFDSRSVSFVNSSKSSLIWNYKANSFSHPLRPFICIDYTWSETNQESGNSTSEEDFY